MSPASHDQFAERVKVTLDVDAARELALAAEIGMSHVYLDRERVRAAIQTVRAAIAEKEMG